MVICAVALVAWGALAFGAVHTWASTPLLIGCASAGAMGLFTGRGRPIDRPLAVCVALVIVTGLLQLVPLPVAVLKAVAPATDAFLRNHELSYAMGATAHPLTIDPQATAEGLLFLAAFSLLLFGLLRALNVRQIHQLAVGVIACGVILAAIGILQKVILGDDVWAGMRVYGFWRPEGRMAKPFGPFVNRNNFAGWMLMALPIACGWALGAADKGFSGARRQWRPFIVWLSTPRGGRLLLTVVATVVMTASLMLTNSRSGLGGLLVVLALVGLAASRRFNTHGLRWGILLIGTAAFAGVVAWSGDDMAARMAEQTDRGELRPKIWSDSVRVIRDFPVTGTGMNTFETVMLGYQSSHPDMHFNKAHNDYLELLVEGGILLTLPVAAGFAVAVRTIRRRFASRRDDTMTHWTRIGATIGLAAIAAQSFVEFSLQIPGDAVLFVVLLALAMHDTEPEAGRRDSRLAGDRERTRP